MSVVGGAIYYRKHYKCYRRHYKCYKKHYELQESLCVTGSTMKATGGSMLQEALQALREGLCVTGGTMSATGNTTSVLRSTVTGSTISYVKKCYRKYYVLQEILAFRKHCKSYRTLKVFTRYTISVTGDTMNIT